MIKRVHFYWTIAILIVIALSFPAYTAIMGEALMNVTDSTVSGTVIKSRRLKDAGNIADNTTIGVLAVGPMMHDGTNWDKITGDTTNGIDVDVTRVQGSITIAGGSTPADGYANPTDAINSWALNGMYNGATWDMVRGDITNGLDVDVSRVQGNVTTVPTETSLNTLLSAVSATGAGTSQSLGSLMSKHSWQIEADKTTADVSWTISLEGSLDDTNFQPIDTFTTITSFDLRHAVNKPVLYYRGNITLLNYTTTAPQITVKSVSGGN